MEICFYRNYRVSISFLLCIPSLFYHLILKVRAADGGIQDSAKVQTRVQWRTNPHGVHWYNFFYVIVFKKETKSLRSIVA